MKTSHRTLYSVLGVAPDAPATVIKAAFRALAKQYHPDGDGRDDADPGKFIELQEAYKILSDEVSRSEYDRAVFGSDEIPGNSIPDEAEVSIDPDEIWTSAIARQAELETLHRTLSIYSPALGNRFQLAVIGGECDNDPIAFAADIDRAFFTKYFGENSEVQGLARRLLSSGNRQAARALNKAVQKGKLKDPARAQRLIRIFERLINSDNLDQAGKSDEPEPSPQDSDTRTTATNASNMRSSPATRSKSFYRKVGLVAAAVIGLAFMVPVFIYHVPLSPSQVEKEQQGADLIPAAHVEGSASSGPSRTGGRATKPIRDRIVGEQEVHGSDAFEPTTVPTDESKARIESGTATISGGEAMKSIQDRNVGGEEVRASNTSQPTSMPSAELAVDVKKGDPYAPIGSDLLPNDESSMPIVRAGKMDALNPLASDSKRLENRQVPKLNLDKLVKLLVPDGLLEKSSKKSTTSVSEILTDGERSPGTRDSKGKEDTLSATSIVAFITQIRSCWVIPPGALEKGLILKVRVRLKRDGSLDGYPEIMNGPGDTLFEALARSAFAAIVGCHKPNVFPADQYDLWKDLVINFNPAFLVVGENEKPAKNTEKSARRVALVIGNSAYKKVPWLENPDDDARAMAEILSRLGYEVTEVTDASLAKTRLALLEFSRSLGRDVEAALFYFSGHAVEVATHNYLLPTDIAALNEDGVAANSLSLADVISAMDDGQVSTKILILDACRNNPLNEVGTTGLAPVKAGSGTFIAYSTSPGTVASDGDEQDRNSPYTTALVKALGKPNRPIEEIFREVRANVVKATGGKQVPWESSSLMEAFTFSTSDSRAKPSLLEPQSTGALDPNTQVIETRNNTSLEAEDGAILADLSEDAPASEPDPEARSQEAKNEAAVPKDQAHVSFVPRPNPKPIEVLMMAAVNMKIEPASRPTDQTERTNSVDSGETGPDQTGKTGDQEQRYDLLPRTGQANALPDGSLEDVPVIRPVTTASGGGEVFWWPPQETILDLFTSESRNRPRQQFVPSVEIQSDVSEVNSASGRNSRATASNGELCLRALGLYRKDWDMRASYAEDVLEVRKRGLTVEKCRLAVGLPSLVQ